MRKRSVRQKSSVSTSRHWNIIQHICKNLQINATMKPHWENIYILCETCVRVTSKVFTGLCAPNQWRSGSTFKTGRWGVPGSILGGACQPSHSEFSMIFYEIHVNTGKDPLEWPFNGGYLPIILDSSCENRI